MTPPKRTLLQRNRVPEMSSLLYRLVRAIGLRPMMNQQIALVMASLLVMEGDFELFGEMHGFILKLGLFLVIEYALHLSVNTLFVHI